MAGAGGIRAGRAYVELFAQLKPLEKGLRQARAKLQTFANGVQNIGRQLFNVAAIGAAPLAFATATYAGFADRMAEVRAVTGATAQQFDLLENKAKALGASTSFSASQVAEGMKFLGMAGFNTEQVLAGIPAVLSLARAGAIELGEAADIASDVGSAFGLSADEIGRVADVMAVTASSANTSISMMGETLKYAAPLAKAAGQSLEDTAAAIGVMGNSGIKASMAGTDLALVMKQIGGEARTGLASMGVESVDAEGNIRSVLDVMTELGDATRNMTEADRLKFFVDNFGRAAKSAIIMADAGDTMGDLRDKIGKSEGAAKRMAEMMDDNLGGSFRKLLSAVEAVQIAFGEAIEGPLRGFVDGMTETASVVAQFITDNAALAQGIAMTVVGLAIGAAAFLGLALALNIVAGGLSVLIGLVGVLGSLIGVLFSPLGAVLVVLVAIGVAMGSFAKSGKMAAEAVGDAFSYLTETLGPVLETLKNALQAGEWQIAADALWNGMKVIFSEGMASIITSMLSWRRQVTDILYSMAEMNPFNVLGGEEFVRYQKDAIDAYGDLFAETAKGYQLDGEMARQNLQRLKKEAEQAQLDAEWQKMVDGANEFEKAEQARYAAQAAAEEQAELRRQQLAEQASGMTGGGNQVEQAWSMAVGSTNSFAAGRIGVQARPMQKVENELQGINAKLSTLIEQGEEDLAFGE